MTPEQLSNWQPQATLQQLNDFINENKTLITLLEETWAKFAATLPQPEPPYHSHYGEGIDINSLEHFPVSDAELAAFLNDFEREREHHDRPFGHHVVITEQDWQLVD